MADNTNVLDASEAPVAIATDELSDTSQSPKVTLLDGTGSPTPISPATSGKQDLAKGVLDNILTALGTPGLPTGAATEGKQDAEAVLVGAVTETAPATDTASSGLNGRLQRIAQRISSLIALLPTSLGSKAAASSLAVTQSTEDAAQLGSLAETAPATDTASSGLNGRLQRIAQRLSSLIALIPAALGQTTKSGSMSVTVASDDDLQGKLGALTETAPASDTASSGLNGRLQRIAQRITSLIALLPTALGSAAAASSLAVTQSTEDVARQGIVTETAPATDTASSGLNGRLQRIAQRLTSLIALVPASLGQKAKTASFAVTLASDDDLLTKIGEVQASPTSNTVLDRLKALLTGTILAAGSAIIGKVGIDQTTPGTTNRVFANPVRLIDVTLSTDTSAYASGDLLADTQQIDAAFSLQDGRGVLHSLQVIDEDDQGVAFDVYFLSGSGSMGTENSAPSISDANAREILCRIRVSVADYTDLGGVKVADLSGLGRAIKAASGTDDLYVAVVNGTGTPTFTASGVRLRLGILE